MAGRKKVSFYDYIMLTRLNDSHKNYYTDFARALYRCFKTKQEEDAFTLYIWETLAAQTPEIQIYNLAAYELWQEYQRISPDATPEQIAIPYYATIQKQEDYQHE